MPLLVIPRLKQLLLFGDALGSPKRRMGVLVALLAVGALVVRVSGASLGGLQEPAEERRTFLAVADTFARSTEPDRNFGTRSAVRTDASPYVASFLRFDPDGLGTSITGAILRVYANSANTGNVDVRGVASNSWQESTLTYRNMPAVMAVASSAGRIGAGTWIQWNVTSLIRNNDPVSFGLTSTNVTATSLASRESAYRPQLVVTFSGPSSGGSSPSVSPSPSPSPSPSTPSVGTSPSGPPPSSPSPGTSPPPSPSPSPSVPSSGAQPTFPIRAAFYYPWFPQAWSQQGVFPYTNYTPSKGLYDSGNRQLVRTHIAEMQRGKIGAGIASWWGQGHHTDSRVTALLDEAAPTSFRWTLYYEAEGSSNPSVTSIQSDLSWISTRYARHGAFLKVGGRPVLFVYGDPGDSCGMADRWVQANRPYGFYLVLKVFSGYRTCSSQPDSWHQYAPAKAADAQLPHSYSIAPGFWKARESVRLARDLLRWRANVRDMVGSGARWQLVVSWNEWGEGTQVEGSSQLGEAWLESLETNGVEPAP